MSNSMRNPHPQALRIREAAVAAALDEDGCISFPVVALPPAPPSSAPPPPSSASGRAHAGAAATANVSLWCVMAAVDDEEEEEGAAAAEEEGAAASGCAPCGCARLIFASRSGAPCLKCSCVKMRCEGEKPSRSFQKTLFLSRVFEDRVQYSIGPVRKRHLQHPSYWRWAWLPRSPLRGSDPAKPWCKLRSPPSCHALNGARCGVANINSEEIQNLGHTPHLAH